MIASSFLAGKIIDPRRVTRWFVVGDDHFTTITKTLRHIELLRGARQRQAAAERAYASLSRYFSPNLAQQLASDTDAVDLAGQRREIATLRHPLALAPR